MKLRILNTIFSQSVRIKDHLKDDFEKKEFLNYICHDSV